MTMPIYRPMLVLATLVAVAGCTAERAPGDAPATSPAVDQPTVDVPPATAPGKTQSMPPAGDTASPALPAGPDGDRGLARFDGYGDIRFGTDAAGMGKAWGGELRTVGKEYNGSCYFMTPTWVKTPSEFNFMIGDGKFVRFGTESAKFVAPGGGKVGMDKAAIGKLYAGAVEEQPHKYSDGQYLRIEDPAGGNGVLVFETDAKGGDAKVTEWRVGVPPQVDYVEGCS